MFAIPTVLECVQRTRAAFRSYLPGTDGWIWPNNIGPTAKVIGGSASEIFERLDYVGRQAFVLFAEGKYLDYHGADFDITRRLAVPAGGNLVITVADAIAIENGALMRRTDGVVVAATAALTLPGPGSLIVPVIAAVPALASNSQPGTPFTIVSGVSGPGASNATIAADGEGLTGGLDIEADGLPKTTDLGTLRGRILFRKRNPPHGGAPADYVLWSTEIPGVTRVFVERHWTGPGTVRIFPMFDTLFAGGIGDAAHIATVQQHIATLQPAAAVVTVQAPESLPIPIAVKGLEPNTEAVHQAVLDELDDTFQRLGQVAGNDGPIASLPFLATPFSFASLWIDQAVANATGEKRAVVLAPTADVVIPSGSIPVRGQVSFQ